MSYVKQILLPDEKILYVGHVHPRILLHGVILLALAAFATSFTAHTGGWHSPVLSFLKKAAGDSSSMQSLYDLCLGWQIASPDVAFEFKLLSLILLLWGLKHLIAGMITMHCTELVVSDMRIIVKTGVLNVFTLEMDRRRVAQVLIDQTVWGRMFNYGHIYIRGFTGVIGGLPVMVNPHLIERYINFRY